MFFCKLNCIFNTLYFVPKHFNKIAHFSKFKWKKIVNWYQLTDLFLSNGIIFGWTISKKKNKFYDFRCGHILESNIISYEIIWRKGADGVHQIQFNVFNTWKAAKCNLNWNDNISLAGWLARFGSFIKMLIKTHKCFADENAGKSNHQIKLRIIKIRGSVYWPLQFKIWSSNYNLSLAFKTAFRY